MPLVHTTDQAARAKARALQQYKEATAPGVVEVVGALGAEAQVLEDALFSLIDNTSVWDAVGVNLDRIGELVGEPRAGDTDDAYRIRVTARIVVNRSTGSIDDLIRVFRALTGGAGGVQVLELFPASIVVRISGAVPSDPASFARILAQARKAGVGSQLEYLAQTPAFGFDGSTGYGFDTGYFGGSL